MDDIGSDSEYSETSAGSASSTSSSSNDNDSAAVDTTELAKIAKHTLRLPKGLCENAAIFREFFSYSTWKSLPDNFQAYLKNKCLPSFPENNEVEQERTLQMFFNYDIKRFKSSPLLDLQKDLEAGTYRPDVIRLQQTVVKARRREQRFQECERVSLLAKNLLISREKLLRTAYNAPPGALLKVDKVVNATPKISESAAAVRAKKRYFEEVSALAIGSGLNDLSDDEFFPDSKMLSSLKRSENYQFTLPNETKIFGTTCRKNRINSSPISTLGALVTLNEDNFKNILVAHKKRKLEEPDHPEFDTNDIRLRDVHARTQIAGGYRKSLSPGRPVGKKSQVKVKQEPDMAAAPPQASDAAFRNFLAESQQAQSQQVTKSPALKNKMQMFSEQQMHSNEMSNSESDDSQVNVETVGTPHAMQIPNDENSAKKRANLQAMAQAAKGSKKIMLNVNGSAVPDSVSGNHSKSSDATDSGSNSMSLPHYHGKIKAATLSDLEGIDMMHLPVDLDDSGHIDILGDVKQEAASCVAPELMQETHACFLSLIRDMFCSTPNHRMRLEELKSKIYTWMSNPITALNDWYSQADNWLALIPSAIHFLAGEFVDQPEDFVPYIEFKTQMNIYQWIGAGRDSDQHLIQLCNYWLARRNEMGSKPSQKFELSSRKSAEFDDSLLSERPISPPPPRCPTSWVVQPATPSEMHEFQAQERHRFENPHRAFTYRMHGYDSVVGPVKGIYTQILALTKARGHNMLTDDRPNFVTILTLVRDATARLPNGEGTRADICELLKSSQYINSEAQDNILQTIVSGALDRMHTEHDPCVRYDPKRKIWIYLHRSRTEDEFERLHQQFQGVGKHKKPPNRKIKPTKIQKPNPDGTNTPSVVVVPPPSNVVTLTKPLPALSSIQNSNLIPNIHATSVATANSPATSSVNHPPPLKIAQQKPVIKPDLVSIKSTTSASERFEIVDVEASLDAQSAPMIVQKPQPPPQQQQMNQTQITSQGISTLMMDNKLQKVTAKKQPMQTTPNTTQIKVSTPTGVQTVHVSAASVPMSSTKQITSILATSPTGQSILVNQNQTVQGMQQNQIVVGNKKLTKPILISQNQGSSIVSQVNHPSGQGYIIPINISNSDQLKALPSMSSALIQTSNLSPKLVKTNQPPGLSTTLNTKPTIIQQTGKNFVRVATTTAQTGKSLISPHIAANNITLQQQQQKIHTNLSGSNISLQQKIVASPVSTTTIRPQIQKTPGVSLLNNTTTVKTHQTLTQVQQKQLLQNIINQQQQQLQQKQRTTNINIGQNTVVIPSGQVGPQQTQTIQTKPVIISQSQGNVQQQIQKIINVSTAGLNTISVGGPLQTSTSSGVNSANVVTSPQPGANLLNPQIIQIHQTGGQHSGTKVQTLNTSNLTPQQQQNLLQSIKQQQLKVRLQQQQQTHSPNQQQSLIIKQQQPVFHQIQKQQPTASSSGNTISVSVASGSPKTVTSIMNTNVSNLISSSTSLGTGNVMQHQTQQQNVVLKHQQQTVVKQQSNVTTQQQQQQTQQQTITRVIKPGTSIIHPQVITSVAGVRTQPGNPVMAKVLTSSSGQIISLESLLQKQGVAPGTTLRVAGAKPGQTSLIQLAGAPGSQITQYAVVSQGRNLISVGAPQRMVTTQASNTNTIMTSLGGPIGKLGDHNKTTTTTINTIQGATAQQQIQNQQQQPKVITANQIQPITAQQLMNAKVISKAGPTGGIRMVNASNLNIAHIRGKPVIIASKPASNVAGQQSGQNVILQSPVNSTNLVIGGQTLKVQGNVVSPSNVQVLNQQSSSQPQTVVLGNQILKVQQAPTTLKSSAASTQATNIISNSISNASNSGMTSIASTNTGTVVVNSNQSMTSGPKTVVLGSTGQTIRVQSPAQVQVQQGGSVGQGQPMVLGTAVKGTTIKNATASNQQRVVLAVQGGGQILLPPGFQGGAINLKTLQGLKVVSLAQQQNKGQSEERPMFAQIVTAPQAPRPPNPGGE